MTNETTTDHYDDYTGGTGNYSTNINYVNKEQVVFKKSRPRFSENAPGWDVFIQHVKELVSLLFCRYVDRHAGGYQRQRRHAWAGHNFRRWQR